MQLSLVDCEVCGKSIDKPVHQIKKWKHHYCSHKCRGLAGRKRVRVTCGNCGKEFEKPAGRAKNRLNNYCSRACKDASLIKSERVYCETCGKEFLRPPRVKSVHNYCSRKCSGIGSRSKILLACEQCGKKFERIPSKTNAGEHHYCSVKCQSIAHSGEGSSQWRGGASFKPYCPRFNTALKEDVRNLFGRRCFLSGAKENGRKLAVHHCDYSKSQGCQGQQWSLLPLDHAWHNKTSQHRWYWFALLRDYWIYKYITFHGMDVYLGPDRTQWLWEIYNR
jgi:endogenous inhibitor of DNA gyrase (YacG/DUF329 family)